MTTYTPSRHERGQWITRLIFTLRGIFRGFA
jgi:hypothetical protein